MRPQSNKQLRNDSLELMRAALLAELAGPGLVRPWWKEAIGLGALHLLISVVLALGWAVMMKEPLALRWQTAVLLQSSVLIVIAASLRPKHGELSLLSMVFVASSIFLLIGFAANSPSPTHPLFESASCALGELAASFVPASFSVLLLARFAFNRLRALLGGTAAALTGLLVLDLTCPLRDIPHVVLFHVLPCGLVIAGFVLVRARLRSRTFVP